jgi:hypothetical protein
MGADFFARVRTKHGSFVISNGALDLLLAIGNGDDEVGRELFVSIAKCQPKLIADFNGDAIRGTALLTIKGNGEDCRSDVFVSYRDGVSPNPWHDTPDINLPSDVKATIAIGFDQVEKGELVFVLIAER